MFTFHLYIAIKINVYLVFIILFWELDVNIMLSADVCYNGTLAANDFGVILGVHSDGQLEAPECLYRRETTLWVRTAASWTQDSFLLLLRLLVTDHGKVNN